ncbi:unnamed protein product (macronuclear) [Paramecium tetraurelia]|uniref:Uncharacterized protein n=1 Tax=Paramecium tetraurelia TaxID=5888 RepID=A0ECM1_PARTE|nr:uncharacterized protein GSPATT00003907001 [Paramecium tetraurelia]CAK93038.1 unnamed protein product [Paramecium tetraurelia]|eukprot:XP_001460435.1 hypothetical protein (macronuclear) [Paramecium tetraurelia strain d4-2]
MDSSGWWIISGNYNGLQLSTCDGSRLFGGFNAFAANTIISKHFSLPSHYQIKVSFELWKIDSWDDETIFIFVDDNLTTRKYLPNAGIELCGVGENYAWYEIAVPITIQMYHSSETLMVIMTTNLDEPPATESWGLRDFKLQVVKCPSGCQYCSDNDYNNCYQWIGIISLWHESILLDGWMKNDNFQPATSQCVTFNLVGGYLNLAPNDKLETIIDLSLHSHFQVQITVQLWKIDIWNNENFQLLVDDQIQNQAVLSTTGTYSICGSTGQENIYNIVVNLPHTSSSCKITMQTNHNVATTNAYWGIRAFNIYLAKCQNGCDECVGPLKTEFTVCSSGWEFYDNICTNSSPMLGITIRITQIKDPKSHERIPMEINLLETNQQIVTQGTFTYTINNNISILNIRVYAKCYPNKKMKSYFIKCFECQPQNQYQFQHYCYGAINSIIYNARFQQTTGSEQELIINTSDTECSIYQVVNVGSELLQIKLLEILQLDI